MAAEQAVETEATGTIFSTSATVTSGWPSQGTASQVQVQILPSQGPQGERQIDMSSRMQTGDRQCHREEARDEGTEEGRAVQEAEEAGARRRRGGRQVWRGREFHRPGREDFIATSSTTQMDSQSLRAVTTGRLLRRRSSLPRQARRKVGRNLRSPRRRLTHPTQRALLE